MDFQVAALALECRWWREKVRERLRAHLAVGSRAVLDRLEHVPVKHEQIAGRALRPLRLVGLALACESALERQRLCVLVGDRLALDAIEREQQFRNVLALRVDRVLLRGRSHVVDTLELHEELEVLLLLVLIEEHFASSYLAI